MASDKSTRDRIMAAARMANEQGWPAGLLGYAREDENGVVHITRPDGSPAAMMSHETFCALQALLAGE